jgi:hypothetical protein
MIRSLTMRARRILALSALVVVAACAPLLSFDDLEGPLDAGDAGKTTSDAGASNDDALSPIEVDGGVVDANGWDGANHPEIDLCVYATGDGFSCGDVLKPGVSPGILYYCVGKQSAVSDRYSCTDGCVQMPANHADICNRCRPGDLVNGTYCVKQVKPDYYTPGNDVLITCNGTTATPTLCAGECVEAGTPDNSTSHCP